MGVVLRERFSISVNPSLVVLCLLPPPPPPPPSEARSIVVVSGLFRRACILLSGPYCWRIFFVRVLIMDCLLAVVVCCGVSVFCRTTCETTASILAPLLLTLLFSYLVDVVVVFRSLVGLCVRVYTNTVPVRVRKKSVNE